LLEFGRQGRALDGDGATDHAVFRHGMAQRHDDALLPVDVAVEGAKCDSHSSVWTWLLSSGDAVGPRSAA
jgi:hypothetical protein